jgi:acetylornithine deacetylase
MIDAARVAAERGLERGRVIVAAVVDEEHSSIGADALVNTWRADGAIVTEPTDLAIAVAHKGFAWVKVDVHGRAAHGSRPKDGQDAILRLGRVLSRLEALDAELQGRPPHPLVGTGSLHASLVEGGRELSSYPDRAVLQMERRVRPGEPESAAIDEVQAIIDALSREDGTFRAEATAMFSRPAYELPAGHDLPATLGAALGAAGRPPRVVGVSFWADSGVLGEAGVPSVLFGPGGAGLHSTEEFVIVEDVLQCRDVLAETARRFC